MLEGLMKNPLTDAVDLSTARRVLVIKLRHHGDVLLTSPVLSVLKQHAPHLEIDALVYQDTAPMLTGHPALAQLHQIDRAWKQSGLLTQARAELRLFTALRARGYDGIIHLTEHRRGAWLTRLLRPRWAVSPAGRHARGFSHRYPVIGGNRRHTVEIHLDALRRIGIQPALDARQLTLIPGAAAYTSIEQRLSAHSINPQQRLIVIHPTSRWLFKTWPVASMAALINQLCARGERVVLSAAPDAQERAMMDAIRSQLHYPVIDLSGQLTLKELAALIARAQLFVGVDSVPMHIAAAMNTPTVALFGPSGEIEWGPWHVPHHIIKSTHACRPCGRDGCGGGKVSECLSALTPATVLTAIDDLLARDLSS